jgi:hypothetical protein
MLAVFNDSSLYSLVGDLVDLTFEPVIRSEGDIGCPSHASLCRHKDILFFMSNKGPMALKAGQIDEQFGLPVRSEFFQQYYEQQAGLFIDDANIDKLVVKRATAVNDVDNNRIIFFIPAEQGESGDNLEAMRPTTSSRFLVFDYIENAWFEWVTGGASGTEYPYNAIGGMAIYQNVLYMVTRLLDTNDNVKPYLLRQSTLPRDNSYCYHDNCNAFTSKIRPQWITEAEPDIFKVVHWLKLWSLAENQVRPFSVRVRTYKDFKTATTSTDTTLTFEEGDVNKKVKLRDDKAGALALDFEVSTIFEKLSLTGFQYLISANYDTEQKD